MLYSSKGYIEKIIDGCLGQLLPLYMYIILQGKQNWFSYWHTDKKQIIDAV